MKNVSNDFKLETKRIKQQNIKLEINDNELEVREVHFMPVNIFNTIPINRLREKKQVIAKQLVYGFDGQLFKTIMKQIEITVKNAKEIKEKDVSFKYGLYINNDFEYVDLGSYFIKDVEDSRSKEELTVTGYDRMIRFMKIFKQSELQLKYPCKIKQLVQKMCEACGVELYSTDFFNTDLDVSEDFFTTQEITYRDVLEKITQATLTTAFIKEDKLYFAEIKKQVVQRLDKSYISDLVIKEKFGPANALVLGRGSVEDNVESRDDDSISKNGRYEIRFDENEFVEFQREKVIDNMFAKINGLEYYSFEGSDIGVMWLEPCDCIELGDRENNFYKSYYLKANITINTGITSDIEAELIEETNTEYKVTTKEEKKTLSVERLAKKNEGIIQDIIKETTESTKNIMETIKDNQDEFQKFVDSTFFDTVKNLQNQIDGAIQFWNGDTVPTINNYPASDWKTEEEKINHTADIYTVISGGKQGKSYRFDKVNGTWKWIELTDNELSAVQALAQSAQSTADSKMKVFIEQPFPPYHIGDLWIKDEELYRCNTDKETGIFVSSEWEKAVKYTDDTKANAVNKELQSTITKLNSVESTADSASRTIGTLQTNIEKTIDTLKDDNNKKITEIEDSLKTTQTNSVFAIEKIKKITEDGVTKLDTKTGYTFDEEGLKIEKTGAKTKTKFNEVGMEVTDNTGSSGKKLLFAGYDEEKGETVVESKNMTVEKYLSIGKNTRFEDYQGGTAAFYTGGEI